jgi:hypothetical protein
MVPVSVPGRIPRSKVKLFTRRQRHAASRIVKKEARTAAKLDSKLEMVRARRDERRLAAFKGIPPESTLALLGVDA